MTKVVVMVVGPALVPAPVFFVFAFVRLFYRPHHVVAQTRDLLIGHASTHGAIFVAIAAIEVVAGT